MSVRDTPDGTAPTVDRTVLRACIEAAQDCVRATIACADACLAASVDEPTACVRTLIDAAEVCDVTARVLSRRTTPDHTLTRALLAACRTACRRARLACEEFRPVHDHCRVGARACRAAERACLDLAAAIDAGPVPVRATTRDSAKVNA